MKTLIASASVVVDKKKELLVQFRAVLYSNTEAEFRLQDKKFVKVCEDVTVKTGKNQDSLAEYYIRNWRSCKEMWVRCYRKSLPCLGDNTSNRVERFFWTMKKAFKDTFMSLPTTMKAAVCLVKFADQRLQEKYIFAQNKVLIIYDKDSDVRENNTIASKWLNDRGCVIFHAAQKRMKECVDGDKFTVDDNVENNEVTEQFSGGKFRTYQTKLDGCSCSFFANHQSPCAHLLFLRMQRSVELFSVDLLHSRYLRSSSSSSDFPPNPRDDATEAETEADLDASFDTPVDDADEITLNSKQKYSMVTPILLRIGNLIACHPTKKFLQYLDGLNELEKRVRKGQNFMLQIKNIVAQAEADSDDDDEDAGGEEEVVDDGDVGMATAANPEPDLNSNYEDGEEHGDKDYDSQDTVRQDDTTQEDIETNIEESHPGKRKFGKIKFKAGLKTKGRPKKRMKQFTFNRSAADRKTGKSNKKKKTPLPKSSSDDDDREDEDKTSDNESGEDRNSDGDDEENEEEDSSSDEEEVVFKKK